MAASGIGTVGAVVANTMLSSVTYLADCSIKNEKVNGVEWFEATVTGGVSGIIGGGGANAKKLVGVINYSRNVVKTAVSPKRIAMYRGKIKSSFKAFGISLARTLVASLLQISKSFGEMKNAMKHMIQKCLHWLASDARQTIAEVKYAFRRRSKRVLWRCRWRRGL